MTSGDLSHQDPPEKSGHRRLRVTNTVSLARHPGDGWIAADPHPMAAVVRRALHAVIRAVVPPPPAPQPADLVERVELYVRRFMSYMHPLAAFGLMFAFVLMDWAPRLLLRSHRRLQGLERSEGARILEQLVHSRLEALRSAVLAARGIILSAYFDQQEVHEALGYAPVPFMRERVARRARLLELRPAPALGRAS
jgi:hypothetical protein